MEMKHRAVIYIRTSSEHQGEKSSPAEQESDCRTLADEKGLTVVKVYRDIEKYRVKNKLVEPSGTRFDRPGLVAMLNAAARGEFDIILAWREDRLYRGMRSMLTVLETVQEHKISILLARETFDPKIAPLRAWVAQMELDGMKERMTMGVKARLRAGKANTGQDRYGYRRVGDTIEIVAEEARWIKLIFAWYLDDVPLMEIRRRLMEANAPQKGSSRPRRIQWARSSIQAILKSAREYASGIKIQRRKGEAFQIPVKPILDPATYDRFLRLRESKKTHPVRNIKHDYLISGLLFCACNRKWVARTNNKRHNRKGELVERKTPIGIYYCPQFHHENVSPDCPRSISSARADAQVWDKVCTAIDEPEYLFGQARDFVEQLRKSADNLDADQARLENEIKALAEERQWVITQARKGKLTAFDMETQLNALTMQEVNLKRELSSLGQAISINALNDWESKVEEYFADLQAGIDGLKNAAPLSEEEQHEVFQIKKQVVNTLVDRVTINRDRELTVTLRLNLLKILEGGSNSGAVHLGEFGIYTRIQSSPSHPHRPASCA
ncbi:MAG: recombinase family protein [Anaerolineales bacterium]|nr:recombinase family protein [Anaerolineales bacterium]